MKDYKPLASSSGGSGVPFSIISRLGSSSLSTALTTSTWVEVDASDFTLPSAGSENGITYLGNGEFRVSEAGDYDLSVEGAWFHSSISGTVGYNLTAGIWNGSSYVADDSYEISDTLVNYNSGLQQSSAYMRHTLSSITLAANGRVKLMIERTSGGQNLRIRGSSLGIYKV